MRRWMAWLVAVSVVASAGRAIAQDSEFDKRAQDTERKMTDDERFSMLISVMGQHINLPVRDKRIPEGIPMSAGYTPGVPRLGVPALLMSDAGLGITNPGYRPGDTATALPAGIALGASFNPAMAREAGAMVGREARARGFNVVLGGGINLARDPRNGRNFEYFSEDPLVTAGLGAAAINGTQSENVISTIKHYAFNDNETNRHQLDAIIDPAAGRESDLLAFQIAIERSHPGAVMCAYNKVNGVHVCSNNDLLNVVLKKAWDYRGWVMSDWGAVYSEDYALNGLDQELGVQFDAAWNGGEWFVGPLRKAYADGRLSSERLSDMVRRILRSIYAVGVDEWETPPKVDMAKHNDIALKVARQGIVLLKNDGVLPLTADKATRIAVIGGHAEQGVPVGTGSSAVGTARRVRGGHQDRRSGRPAEPPPSPNLASRRAEEAPAQGADRIRPRAKSGRGRPVGAAVGYGRRLWDSHRRRGLRSSRSDAAMGAGRRHRRCSEREPEHDRYPRDWQSGRHALARQGEGHHRGVVSRPGGRAGNRRSAYWQGESFGAPPDYISS